MEIPNFIGDEDKDEINLEEWLRMVKNKGFSPFGASLGFLGGTSKWWNSLDEYTRFHATRENFEESSQINGSRIKERRRCVKFKRR
jgi:hypothetical protein